MEIRNAEKKDINGILKLLSQVLELHAAIRPDIFVSGTTKYTEKELIDIFADKNRRTYVAAEGDSILGYVFCEIKEPSSKDYIVPFSSLYIDDLCVDDTERGKHIGSALFEHAKNEAKRLDCYELTLNVWEGNSRAKAFYEKKGMKPKETNLELILK